MDLDDYLSNAGNIKKSSIIANATIVENDCTIKSDINVANNMILKGNFHSWDSTIESSITGESKKDKKVDVAKPGFNMTKWEKAKRLQLEGDDMASKIYKALHPELCKPVEKVENNYENELLRFQMQKQLRAKHEQMMAKCRTNKKIKAKNYHRHVRKRDIKEFLRKDVDKLNTEETKERLDRLRAEERISLKHKTSGKFAKLNKLRAKYDENAREALDQMHNKAQELTRRVEGDTDCSEDEGSDVEGGEVSGGSDSDGNDSGMEEVAVADSNDFIPANHSLSTFSENDKQATVVTKHTNLISVDTPMLFDQDDTDAIDEDEEMLKETIYQAYQEDTDLISEFDREKALEVKKEAPQDIVTYIPGWGDWTGPGLESNDERRKKKSIIKAPTAVRTDGKKPRVWIKQSVHDGLKKHLVKTIPYPYNTVEQYELSRKQLVSSAFTMETIHRKLSTPRVKVRPGIAIRPIRATAKDS